MRSKTDHSSSIHSKPQGPSATTLPPLLAVRNLSVGYVVHGQIRRVVQSADLDIEAGKTTGLVGESGSGKSTLVRAILRLIHSQEGSIYLDGVDILRLSRRQMRAFRRHLQVVFQDSAGSLNPRMSIGDTVAEPLVVHGMGTRRIRRQLVAEALSRVGLPSALSGRFPHELSGGQRQRVNIARALVLRPRLVICDEPVSALDVSVQAQILNLLRELQRDFGIAYLFISHHLGVVGYMSDRVAVMYRGRIVEQGATEDVFRQPQSEYTRHLIEATMGGAQ